MAESSKVMNMFMGPVFLNFQNNENKMHKKRSLQLRISSVYMNKSAVSCEFVTITEEILNGELHFFVCNHHITSFFRISVHSVIFNWKYAFNERNQFLNEQKWPNKVFVTKDVELLKLSCCN